MIWGIQEGRRVWLEKARDLLTQRIASEGSDQRLIMGVTAALTALHLDGALSRTDLTLVERERLDGALAWSLLNGNHTLLSCLWTFAEGKKHLETREINNAAKAKREVGDTEMVEKCPVCKDLPERLPDCGYCGGTGWA
jgi:hypothetical protein